MNAGIMYVEADLSDVLDYYVKGYTLTNKGQTILECEPFVDVSKNTVVFKIIFENTNN